MRRMRKRIPSFPVLAVTALLALAAALILLGPSSLAQMKAMSRAMPEFTSQSKDYWINSAPLKKADLNGKVVLIEIWTSI